jgi:anion-transporting  ArsA/GET3 family ATPase
MGASQKQIILVTGKGGVGKSTVAAAIAVRESNAGRKTLLVELGDESFFQPFFDLSEISYEPQQIAPKLFVAIWNVEHCLREYVLHFLKVERLYRIFFENRVMKTFINAAPAISELAILGKVTSNYRNHGPPLPFDVVVVDAYATGHFLALLRAPKGLSEAVRSGPFGQQSTAIMNALLNPEVTGYTIVTLPEMLPVMETEELYANLKNEFGVDAEIVCNRILEIPQSENDIRKLTGETKTLRPFLNFLAYVLHRQKESLERVSKIPAKLFKVRQSLTSLKGTSLAREVSEDLG